MFKNKKILIAVAVIALTMSACSSSVHKADIPMTANPQEEITKLDADINAAVLKNVDVLAKDEFEKSVKWFDEAKSDLENKKKQEVILDDLRRGRGFLEQAYAAAGDRMGQAPTLFEARQMALTAGAGMRPELRRELKDVDGDVSSRANKLDKISSEDLIKFQSRYIELEKDATVLTQLSNAQAIVSGAKKDGAARKTPSSYKKAELALKNAESVIATNVRSPNNFQAAVAQANTEAIMLKDVMAAVRQDGKDVSEQTALKLVNQNRQIKTLNTDLSASAKAANEAALAEQALQAKNQELATTLDSKSTDLESAKSDLNVVNQNLDATRKDLSTANSELTTTSKELNSTKASVEVQKAIESARKQFSADEAEAYQQGNSLLIRLKKVNFASGQAQLPGSSLSVLAKVSNVAKQLKASEIKVEGHTDSTGTADKNKTISEERADAVATYFKTNGFKDIDVQASGFGFEKPIATNKSKEGRAMNRRVDIIITPESQIAQ